jgi:stage V sporulation protein S
MDEQHLDNKGERIMPGPTRNVASDYEEPNNPRMTDYGTPAPARPVSQPDLQPGEVEVLKVSGNSRPSSVAGAIAGVIRQAQRVEVQAIGAGATNQAVKAIAIARGYLISSGIDIMCIPAFIDVTIDNEERTAIKLLVERRPGYGVQ